MTRAMWLIVLGVWAAVSCATAVWFAGGSPNLALGFAAVGLIGVSLTPCCCGETCAIFSDNFDDETITGWTVAAGTWTESSGRVRTLSSDAIMWSDSVNPDAGGSNFIIRCTVRISTGTARILFAGDGTDYYYVEIAAGTHWKVGRWESSADTELALTTNKFPSISSDYEVILCVEGDEARLWIGGREGFVAFVEGLTPFGDQFGLASGSGGSQIEFDEFTFDRIHSECPPCDIDPCSDCQQTDLFQVQADVSGIADISEDCDAFNGTYILTWSENEVGAGVCRWRYDDGPTWHRLLITVLPPRRSLYEIRDGVGGAVNFGLDIPSGEIDCLATGDYEAFGFGVCNVTSAVVSLSVP